MRLLLPLGLCAATLSGCMTSDGPGDGSAGATMPTARATLVDAAGASKGTATITETPAGLKVAVVAMGLPQGTHGLHFHMVGRCDAPGFESAGSHWNPTSRQHGRDNPRGAHQGDLPNIDIGSDGTGRAEATVAGARLTGDGALLDADGATLMVHATADDYRTDPSGNSGARIACGVVTAA